MVKTWSFSVLKVKLLRLYLNFFMNTAVCVCFILAKLQPALDTRASSLQQYEYSRQYEYVLIVVVGYEYKYEYTRAYSLV